MYTLRYVAENNIALSSFIIIIHAFSIGCSTDTNDIATVTAPSLIMSLENLVDDEIVPDRLLLSVRTEKVAQIGVDSSYYLINVGGLDVIDSVLVVYDYGDKKVKTFSFDGSNIATYGHGIGEAPGEMGNPVSANIVNNEVYILDSYNNRINIFNKNGHYIDRVSISEYASDEYYNSISSMSFNGIDSSFILFNRSVNNNYLKYSHNTIVDIGPTYSEMNRNDIFIIPGVLRGNHEYIVYVPFYFPIITKINLHDDGEWESWYTPDKINENYTYPVVPEFNNVFIPPQKWLINSSNIVVEEHKLIIRNKLASVDGEMLFDFYNLVDNKYEHSITVPMVNDVNGIATSKYIITEQDTLVTIHSYEVEVK